MTAAQALLWIDRLVIVALVQQTIEFLGLHGRYRDQGIWSWSAFEKDFERFPPFLRRILSRFELLLIIQLGCAIAAWFFPPAFPILLLTNILVLLRWRGTFNGGSDFMTLVVLIGGSIGVIFKSPLAQKGALWYIAIQVCLSYFISGVIKLRRSNWRSGKALAGFIRLAIYDSPGAARVLTVSPVLAWAASWSVLVFEVSFPAALLGSQWAMTYVGVGVLFHLGVFYTFGLNRFLFAWLAAYPALVYCAGSH